MTTLVTKAQKDIPPLIRVTEAARLLTVSKGTIYNLLQSGELTGSCINPISSARLHLRITRASLLAFYKKRFGHSLLRALNHSYEN